MSRGPLTFKQRDVTRAVKGVIDAGIEVERVEVDRDGKIVVVAGTAAEPVDGKAVAAQNEWDSTLVE